MQINSVINETIEKHDTLNPKLFNADEKLKKEVHDKVLEIVDEFTKSLDKDGIKIDVDDIIIIGSNAGYNYTKNSDIDLHIIANTKKLKCPDDLYPLLYSAYRSLFNKKFDISFYGIPVEIYVETDGTPRVSNGVYSVKDDKWIKKPVASDIPDLDTEKFNEELKKWKKRYQALLKKVNSDLSTEDEVEDFINEIYMLRKDSISAEGEYGTPNLLFKEMRNLGYLDKLKDIKNQLKANRLSLESLEEAIEKVHLSPEELYNAKRALNYLTGYAGSIVVLFNGYFHINNVKQNDLNRVVMRLRDQDNITNVYGAAGRYDFSNPVKIAMGNLPDSYYTVSGQITSPFTRKY